MLEGEGRRARGILNPDPLLFHPPRPECPGHLRASAFLPGSPRVSGPLSAQRCLNGAGAGAPRPPSPARGSPGGGLAESGARLPDAAPGAWRCREARFRPRVWPRSPPPRLPIPRRGRARCAGGRARRGPACPRRGGKLSWEKLGAAGASPEVGTGEPSGARGGAGGAGETPEAPGALSPERAGERRGGGGGGPGRGGRRGRRGSSGLAAGREWKRRKGRGLGRGRAVSGEKDGEAMGELAGLERDRGSASLSPNARAPRPLCPGGGSPRARRRPS